MIYEHYGRRGSTTNLTIGVRPAAFSDGTTTFNFTIDAMGSVTGLVGLPEEEPIELTHFFTP